MKNCRNLAKKMDIEIVKKILPHRYPFLLIDKVVSRIDGPEYPKKRKGGKIVALKNVSINEPFFGGHFPHKSIMPGVLLIEAMAQACALLAYKYNDPPQDVIIISINNAKFRKPVYPGDTLIIMAENLRDKGSLLEFDCKVLVEDKVVAESILFAKMFDLKIEDNVI